MSDSFSGTAAFLWSVADLLRGDFRQSQYGRIILPFTLLRRLECVLEPTKEEVLKQKKMIAEKQLPEQMHDNFYYKAVGKEIKFYNTSEMNLSKLGTSDIKEMLNFYIQSFSESAREIFDYFNFEEFLTQLDDADLLFKVVQKFGKADLSPKAISNHDMGKIFEELIRRFAESSNDTAGEHFTPRDIVELTTSLVFMEDDQALASDDGAIRTIYDPTAGTGGFLSSGMEYVSSLNPDAKLAAFGQELNPESYAICKADMLIKGQDVSNIKLGNTLSQDQLFRTFDYMLSNPPFGVDWKKIEASIKEESQVKGFDGRFGPGLPRVSDGSLLFLLHLISKFQSVEKGGSRIGIILNGSPLFTGGAGSGESEIRRYVLENDLVESIVALPTDMFYNTGISTYVWVLSNKKSDERKDKVQLIDASEMYQPMRKSLGSKRRQLSDDQIKQITRAFGEFTEMEMALDTPEKAKSSRGRKSATAKKEKPKKFSSKIFAKTDFGYRRITVERPLRLSVQLSDEKLAELKYAPKPLNAAMKFLDENYPASKGSFTAEQEVEIRKIFKADFKEIKEKAIKELLDSKLWDFHAGLFEKAISLQAELGTEQFNDWQAYEIAFKKALKSTKLKLEAKEKKQFETAITWTNPDAEPVIKKIHKVTSSDELYGLFKYQGQIVEFKPDGNLRDNENIPLDPTQSTVDSIEAYFKKEVKPHVSDAWIDASKKDASDGEIGIVGYEIPFNRHFYQYIPPRSLTEIDSELDELSADIMDLLAEVHS